MLGYLRSGAFSYERYFEKIDECSPYIANASAAAASQQRCVLQFERTLVQLVLRLMHIKVYRLI